MSAIVIIPEEPGIMQKHKPEGRRCSTATNKITLNPFRVLYSFFIKNPDCKSSQGWRERKITRSDAI
jgi:hypothetical protein